MSTSTTIGVGDFLEPELIDLITEAVVWPNDAARRAEVLAAIIGSAIDALRWRLQPDGAPEEEASALDVLRAAGEHVDRMRTSS